MPELITIGELASRSGVPPSTLRYYEEIGLMPPARRVSGQRRYGEQAVGLLAMILFFRDVGFSLAETKRLIASRSRSPDAWRGLARDKLAQLDEGIARAQVARIALQHALRCGQRDILECPNFARVIAGRREGKALGEAHRR